MSVTVWLWTIDTDEKKITISQACQIPVFSLSKPSLKAAYLYAVKTKKNKPKVVQKLCFGLNFYTDYEQRGGLGSLYTLTLWESSELNPDLLSLYLKCATAFPVLHPVTLSHLDN